MYKHILFDFDGTIADSEESIVEVYNIIADRFSFKKITHKEYRLLNNSTVKEKLKILGIPFYRLFFMGGLDYEFFTIYKEYLNKISIFDGMKEILLKLKHSGFKLSIITSNSIDNILLFLKSNNLQIFDDIHSAKGFFGKNRAFVKYLKKHGLRNKDVIYIGDELRDIIACKKANIDMIAVKWGLDSEELLKSGQPEYLVGDCRDIFDIVQKSGMT
ncbi:MAG: HAD-IA family hydrolase [Clostridiaceae bacterium]|nr:HAD-IA family hydrolase [Clostridiaceae bacterium]